ncbi:MAG: PfkB family carbohydrate kinase [Candidatus Omnitrophica bacterium]|nr:PfkB family carbohydrate kinase [Candidatus Omnitrophota bacterium]
MKIKSIDELSRITGELKQKKKKIIHCHGVFDLLHPGHIKHFEAAKNHGDVLVVTITRDEFVNKGPGRPIFNQRLRAESIAAIESVDYVAVNDWPSAVETIRRLKPDLYVKGKDYAARDEDITGKISEEEAAVKSVGGSIHFTDEISFSSSALINSFFTPYPEEAKDFFQQFRRSHSAPEIINALKSTKDLKVLVIGDIIIDEYHYCTGIGKAQKDNIIVTRYVNEQIFAGGVLAAANHVAGFCENVTLVTCIGTRNDYVDFINRRLKPNIVRQFYFDEQKPTVVKRRFVDPAFLNKLFEICYIDQNNQMPPAVENQICEYLEANIGNFDLVLTADFGHGMITARIVDLICRKANYLAVNVQTNSANIGYNLITKFPRADYICIDEPEIRLACSDKYSDLEKLILNVSRRLNCERVVITRGHRGALAYAKKEGFSASPVFSRDVVDRIGAGDAFFSVTAPCAARGNSMDTIGFIGNAAGAMKVLIVGNSASVEPVPLYKYITTLLK